MIEQLAEHGVTAQDLVPSLVTTHVVDNPEYDPDAAAEMEREELEAERVRMEQEKAREEEWAAARARELEETVRELENETASIDINSKTTSHPPKENEISPPPIKVSKTSSPFDTEGDIGVDTMLSPTETIVPSLPPKEESIPTPTSPNSSNFLPSSLPGVSKTLTAADKTITLDIRWTILCDLFLSLIADSVYDARSRVLLGRIADKLGLDWLDVVRFERRLTEALEIQEGVQKKEHEDVLEEKRKQGKRQRYMMMGLATLGTKSSLTAIWRALTFFCRWRISYWIISWFTRSCNRSRIGSSFDYGWSNWNDWILGWCWWCGCRDFWWNYCWISRWRKSDGQEN